MLSARQKLSVVGRIEKRNRLLSAILLLFIDLDIDSEAVGTLPRLSGKIGVVDKMEAKIVE
ncbi:hypothetical protein G9P44_001984 [Scheffersomyces stipitis]|nr:hypothetical protein G9P44_001984 [Scheffersomyces stipitis]